MKHLYKILFLFFSYTQVQAQVPVEWDSKVEAATVGDVLVLTKRYHNPKYKFWETYSELRLGPTGRVKIAAALKKGLEWAEINKTRKFTFEKYIVESTGKAFCFQGANMHNYSTITVVFEGISGDEYLIRICGDRNDNCQSSNCPPPAKQPFNIEKIGYPLLTFSSSTEVERCIKLLEQKEENLDDIFK